MSHFTSLDLAQLSNSEKDARLNELSQRLIMPYAAMALVLLVLAVMLYFSPLPEPAEPDDHGESEVSLRGILKFPHLILGAITLFFYVGAEVIAGDTIALFAKSIGVASFAALTAYTMAFMVLGYVLGILCIPRFVSQQRALAISALLGVVLSIAILATDPSSTHLTAWIVDSPLPDVIYLVALLGLANALVWPAVWPLALNGLGRYTSMGSALLIMGISGGAILPMIYGAIADATSDLQLAYWILIPGYLCILFYALKGHRIQSST